MTFCNSVITCVLIIVSMTAVKEGMCPVLPTGTAGLCEQECKDDSKCDGRKKCCYNGCGKTCQDPSVGKNSNNIAVIAHEGRYFTISEIY